MARRRTSAALDAAIGAGAGLFASWVMSLAYAPIMRAGGEAARRREREAAGDLPPATILAAQRAAEALGRALPEERDALALGGKIIHYAYGTAWGAGFALAARAVAPRAPVSAGLAFGIVLWVLSDEMLVPLFKLSHPPTRYPVTSHAKGLASHLVYGVATDAAWRLARAPLG